MTGRVYASKSQRRRVLIQRGVVRAPASVDDADIRCHPISHRVRSYDRHREHPRLEVDPGRRVVTRADAKQVSVRAGHSSVAFTLDRYGGLFDDAEDKVTDRLEALFTSARPAADGDVRRLP